MLRGDICCFTGSFLCSTTQQHWTVGENWEGKKGRKVCLSFSLVLNQHRFQLKLRDFLFFKDLNFLCYLVFSGIVPELGKQCG